MLFLALVVQRCARLCERRQLGGGQRFVGRHRKQVFAQPEQIARVAVRHRDQRVAGAWIERERPIEMAFGTRDDLVQVFDVQAIEGEYLRPRQEGRHQAEARILGGGPDQHERAVLDRRQHRILYWSREAVQLVDEHRGRLAGILAQHRGCGDRLSQVDDAGRYRRQLGEFIPRLGRDQPGDRRLADAGRAPQDERRQPLAAEHAAQRTIGSEEMVLADDLRDGGGAQFLGERPGDGACEQRAGHVRTFAMTREKTAIVRCRWGA